MNIPLLAAIELLGGEKKTAKALGVTPAFITSMKNGSRPVPLARALQLEELTEGAIKFDQIRPEFRGMLAGRSTDQGAAA